MPPTPAYVGGHGGHRRTPTLPSHIGLHIRLRPNGLLTILWLPTLHHRCPCVTVSQRSRGRPEAPVRTRTPPSMPPPPARTDRVVLPASVVPLSKAFGIPSACREPFVSRPNPSFPGKLAAAHSAKLPMRPAWECQERPQPPGRPKLQYSKMPSRGVKSSEPTYFGRPTYHGKLPIPPC